MMALRLAPCRDSAAQLEVLYSDRNLSAGVLGMTVPATCCDSPTIARNQDCSGGRHSPHRRAWDI